MKNFLRIMKSLSDGTRVRIMRLLVSAGIPLCICEIVDALGLRQYHVSRHMKELKIAGLVQEQREGRYIFYSLNKPDSRNARTHEMVLRTVLSLPVEEFLEDDKRLNARLKLRNEILAVQVQKAARKRNCTC